MGILDRLSPIKQHIVTLLGDLVPFRAISWPILSQPNRGEIGDIVYSRTFLLGQNKIILVYSLKHETLKMAK